MYLNFNQSVCGLYPQLKSFIDKLVIQELRDNQQECFKAIEKMMAWEKAFMNIYHKDFQADDNSSIGGEEDIPGLVFQVDWHIYETKLVIFL